MAKNASKPVKDYTAYRQYTSYSVQTPSGKVICVDWYTSRRGAAFACMLVDLGVTEDQLNFIDCDDIATSVVHSNPASKRKDAMRFRRCTKESI